MEELDTLVWRKARASGSNGGNCVEIAFDAKSTAAGLIRDSKRPEAGSLRVAEGAWARFLADVKAGHREMRYE